MKTKTKIKKSRRMPYLVLAVSLAPALGAGSLYLWHRHQNQQKVTVAAPNPSGIRPSGSIDYSPAKPGENAANSQRKGSSSPSSTITQSTPGTTGSGSQASPSISIAGANKDTYSSNKIVVSATVENVTSGTCTFNFSRINGGPVIKSYSEAVSYTGTYYSCSRQSVSMPTPSSGDWYVSAVLTYGSQTVTDKWPSPVVL